MVTADKIAETSLERYNVIPQPCYLTVSRICIAMFTYVSLHSGIFIQPRPTRISDGTRSVRVEARGIIWDYFNGFGNYNKFYPFHMNNYMAVVILTYLVHLH